MHLGHKHSCKRSRKRRSWIQSHKYVWYNSFILYYFIYSLWKTDLDIGEDWVDSEDESELGDYTTEKLPAEIVNKAERKQSQTVRIIPDQRKTSTGSQVPE